MAKRIVVVIVIALCQLTFGATEKETEIALALQNAQKAIKAVVEKAAPTVVCIESTEKHQLKEIKAALKILGNASGIIISSDGHILTNDHVVRDASKLRVTLDNGKKYPAKFINSDPRSDLAVIKIKAENLPVAKLSSKEIYRGMFAIALGSPFGFGQEGQISVSFGIVSATGRYIGSSDIQGLDRYYGNMIQTDTAMNPGNSGGPLYNLRGEVIGINTAIFSKRGASEGVGFAIPINKETRKIINKLIKGEKIVYGYLGAYLETPKAPPNQGAFVTKVMADSPAEKAGLKPKDLITKFQGKEIEKADELVSLVGFAPIGTEIKLTYIRRGKEYTTKVIIAERPSGKSKIKSS